MEFELMLMSKATYTSKKGASVYQVSCTWASDKPVQGFVHAGEFFVTADVWQKLQAVQIGKRFKGFIAFYNGSNHLINVI